MSAPSSPAIEALLARLGDNSVIAEVNLRRCGEGFELRHIADRDVAESALRVVTVNELRSLAQNTEAGAFRPIKAAPNLRKGWRVVASSIGEVESALDHLYPGAVTDWHAAEFPSPPVTDYRDYTARQTGMYRITTMLDDTQAARMVAACCDARFCLKRRLWTVGSLAPDTANAKSIVPCLEPCAVLLEFARKAMRLEQEDKVTISLTASEIESVQAALDAAGRHLDSTAREADFSNAANPRRLQLLGAKLAEVKTVNANAPAHH